MTRLIIDVDTKRIVTSVAVNAPQSTGAAVKRGDTDGFECQFIQNGVVIELNNATTFLLGVKPKTALNGVLLANSTTFTKTGTGTSTLYTTSPGWNSAELTAHFAEKQEPATILVGLEVTWTLSGVEKSTQVLTLTIENDLNRSSDGSPTVNDPLYYTGAQSDARYIPLANISPNLLPANNALVPTVAAVNAGLATAILTPAQITSKVGEQLSASLQNVWASNEGTTHFSTIKVTAGTITATTSTGYARLINADGSLGSQVGTGVAGTQIALTIPASGGHRAYGVISVANGGNVRSGNITSLYLYGNQLTSLIFTGWTGNGFGYLTAQNNQLSATALDAFYTSLGTFSSGKNYLNVFNNPGTTADTPSIATSKGWMVYGSD